MYDVRMLTLSEKWLWEIRALLMEDGFGSKVTVTNVGIYGLNTFL